MNFFVKRFSLKKGIVNAFVEVVVLGLKSGEQVHATLVKQLMAHNLEFHHAN